MCDGHSDAQVFVNGGFVGVDHCIVPLVKALNDAGYRTIASCCGHGEHPVTIPLYDRDGIERWLILARSRDEGELMAYGPSCGWIDGRHSDAH